MIRLSLVEKLKSLVTLMTSSWVFMLLFIGFILLSIFLYKGTQGENKKGKQYFLGGYSVLLIGCMLFFHEPILNFLDHFMDNIFMLICFPSMALYIAMIIFLNVIMIKTLLNTHVENYIKGIHFTVYGMVHFLFILILSTISKNNIDIFSKISIYTDKDLLNLIEMSMGIIILWGIILVVIAVIHKLSSKESAVSTHFYLDLNPTLEPIVIASANDYESKPLYPKTASTISVEEKKEDLEHLTISDYKRLKMALIELGKESK